MRMSIKVCHPLSIPNLIIAFEHLTSLNTLLCFSLLSIFLHEYLYFRYERFLNLVAQEKQPMEASHFPAHHRPLLPPPFFLSPGSRLSSTAPPHSPMPQRLFRPAPTSESSLKFAPAYSHSIARLAGIQSELEEAEREAEERDMVDSSEVDVKHHSEDKKSGYKINRRLEKSLGNKEDGDIKKVQLKINDFKKESLNV